MEITEMSPQGWDGANSFYPHPPQGLKISLIAGEAALNIHTPFPSWLQSPALPLSLANSQTPKGVGNPDISQVLAHLRTKCSIIINDHDDNSAYYYRYCSHEKKNSQTWI